jgi:apolipoprotein D and lipocalin family protein
MNSNLRRVLFTTLLLLSGCVKMPDNVSPVSEFDLNRYMGKWYEIARLDHSFERGLTSVTATYSQREDGGVRVINRGYNADKELWKSAEGKAYFVGAETEGYLKVSFFGPFYGSYVILELDRKNYSYALVCGPNRNYLWVLSRTPVLDGEIVDRLVQKAKALGFETEKLIYVAHKKVEETDQSSRNSST